MSDKLATVKNYFTAMQAKDIDGALELMSEGIVLHSPMGKKTGKEKVRGMLNMIANMGGGPEAEPELDGDTVIGYGKSPMGKVKLTFLFDGDLISEVKTKIGG